VDVVEKVKEIVTPKKHVNDRFLVVIPAEALKLFSIHQPTGERLYVMKTEIAAFTKLPGRCVFGDGYNELEKFLKDNLPKHVLEPCGTKKKPAKRLIKKIEVEVKV
jgi:hypothetical protein